MKYNVKDYINEYPESDEVTNNENIVYVLEIFERNECGNEYQYIAGVYDSEEKAVEAADTYGLPEYGKFFSVAKWKINKTEGIQTIHFYQNEKDYIE